MRIRLRTRSSTTATVPSIAGMATTRAPTPTLVCATRRWCCRGSSTGSSTPRRRAPTWIAGGTDMAANVRRLWIAASFAASLAACATNPVTGKKDLMLVGESEELSIGQQNYSPMRQSEGGDYVLDPTLTSYVQKV